MVPLPASPGPSLEVPDELLLLSPLAHPEFVGDDVAGMDTALGTGPAKAGWENSHKPSPLRGVSLPPSQAPPDTDLMTASGKFCWLFRQVRRQPRQWAWVQLGRMPKIRSASGLSHTLSMQMPHTTSRLSCSLCSHTQGQGTSMSTPSPDAYTLPSPIQPRDHTALLQLARASQRSSMASSATAPPPLPAAAPGPGSEVGP